MKNIIKKFVKSAILILIISIFICSGCSRVKDEGNNSATRWYTGILDINSDDVNFSANNGDYYLNTTNFSVYCFKDNEWEFIGTLVVNNDDNYVYGQDGSTGVTIKNIEYNYEYDEGDKRYLVTTFYFTDDREPLVTKNLVPVLVESISSSIESKYYIGQSARPEILIKYRNGESKSMTVTEDMYVIEDDFVKPDFDKSGYYNIKLKYDNYTVNKVIEVVEAELYVPDEVCAGCGDNHGIVIKIFNKDGTIETVNVTSDMFVVNDVFEMPDFYGNVYYKEYLTKIVYQNYEFIQSILVVYI